MKYARLGRTVLDKRILAAVMGCLLCAAVLFKMGSLSFAFNDGNSLEFVPVVISAGNFHSLAIDKNGYLWAWGANGSGQLGDGTDIDRYVPSRHVDPGSEHYSRKYTAVSAGSLYSLALDEYGHIWAWGENYCGMLGIGEETGKAKYEPVRHIDPDSEHYNRKYTAISAGENHSLAIDEDGHIWAWGGAIMLGIGDESNVERYEPVRHIDPDSEHYNRKYIAVSAGFYYSLGLDKDGHLWAWGQNYFGRLGIGGDDPHSVASEPMRHVDPLSEHYNRKYSAISAGFYHSLGIDKDGYLWAWGYNSSGELGIGDDTSDGRIEPARHVDTLSEHYKRKYSAIFARLYRSFAVGRNGELLTWGDGNCGANPDTCIAYEPVCHSSDFCQGKYAMAAAGLEHFLVLDSNGYLWAYGSNNFGQLGDGTTADSDELTQISFVKPEPSDKSEPADADDIKPLPELWFMGYLVFGFGTAIAMIVMHSRGYREPWKDKIGRPEN